MPGYSTSNDKPVPRCIYTFTRTYECDSDNWNTPQQTGSVSVETNPLNIGTWAVLEGVATIRVDAGDQVGTSCPSPTEPTSVPPNLTDYCKYYTYNGTYDCATTSWSIDDTSSTEKHAVGSIQDSWEMNGCGAIYRDSIGYSPDEVVTPPSDPAFPSMCCAMPFTGAVADSGAPTCCGTCVGSSASSASAGACACPVQTIDGVKDVIVAPLTAQRLLNMTGGTNVVNVYASTGQMLDRISIKSGGVDIADTTNGSDTANILPGPLSFDVNLELCFQQTGEWINPISNQNTQYTVSADWDLLVYVSEEPLSNGVNDRPADSVVDIIFNNCE